MFSKRKSFNITAISAEYFVKCFGLAKMWIKQADAYTYTVEMLAIFYVMVDLAMMNAEKDRYKAAGKVMNWAAEIIKMILGQDKSDDELKKAINQYHKRIDFYGEIIRGKELRNECMLFHDTSVISNNSILRCAVAFTDCLVNPECIENYDNAPTMLSDITRLMSIAQQTMMPLGKELFLFYKAIYDNA